MVALDLVHASNAQLRDLGPGLVALFVGGTSGIGEATAKAFIRNTISPKIYIVGRNASAAQRIIEDCKILNKDGKVDFIQADVTELAEVDRVCKQIVEKEKHINLLVQTQGNLSLRGRDESPEGLPRKFVLNYYSRMRFISNLLPLLHAATETAPHFSRTLSILGAGTEGKIDFADLELKKFSVSRCAAHSIVMNDFMTAEFAKREPATSFIHSAPLMVFTGITRELPLWAKWSLNVFKPLIGLFAVSVEETGARQLFTATSGLYPPAKPFQNSTLAAGVPVPKGLKIMPGEDGKDGSGGYIVNWDNEITGNQKILGPCREKGFGKIAWDHTMRVFERTISRDMERANV